MCPNPHCPRETAKPRVWRIQLTSKRIWLHRSQTVTSPVRKLYPLESSSPYHYYAIPHMRHSLPLSLSFSLPLPPSFPWFVKTTRLLSPLARPPPLPVV